MVFDDHSDDGTDGICEDLGCEVIHSRFEGTDEARDKNALLAGLWDRGAEVGDWIFAIDGDELLNPADVELFDKAVTGEPRCWSLPVVYLWDTEDQIRIDRWYSTFHRPSLFPLTSRRVSFLKTSSGGNFHCGNVPAGINCKVEKIAIRLIHFGYLHREDRIRKFEWYNTVDPNNAFEDGYRHMVIGDLPELPASSRLRWAGPLELQPSPYDIGR